MQRKIREVRGTIVADLIIPGSKSMTHRALLLASLADGVSEISGMQTGIQTLDLLSALHQLGIAAQFDSQSRSCIVAGGSGQFPKKQATLWLSHGRTLTHFLLAATAQTQGLFYFDGPKRLRNIPLEIPLHILCRQGAQITPNDASHLPFTLAGADSLEGGDVTLDNAVHAAFISALFMIAPFARSAFHFTILNHTESYYLEMTCNMMAQYGVLVHRIHQGQFKIPVPQRYFARDYTVEADFALAAYFFAAAAITNGEITIQAVKHYLSKQRDVIFLSLLEKMGCQIRETHRGLTVKGPATLQGIETSLTDFNDTFAALAAIAPFAKSPTHITHTGELSEKESKRLQAINAEFIKLGIQVESGDNWLKIFPSKIKSGTLDSHDDHCLAMAFSLIGLKIPGITIANADCVAKVYADFYTEWDKLSESTHAHAS